MLKENYDKQLLELCEQLVKSGERKKLLLHSCCAPCSTYCIQALREAFDITVLYYNPNLDTEKEYELRSSEQARLCKELGLPVIILDYDSEKYLDVVKGYEGYEEGKERCLICFDIRLLKTAEMAKQLNFDYFATTLTVSPLKNANVINKIGRDIEKRIGVKYLPTDFKKRNGYLQSVELSKQYNLYRQNYCGCKFSKPEN